MDASHVWTGLAAAVGAWIACRTRLEALEKAVSELRTQVDEILHRLNARTDP